ncbi:Cyclin [Geosmithia morbida]|uniref:Cyclin n=1 Tax=Geosmithia morbida TaxID=1094350 RepID=A0A9P4YWW9_9HYPO|nr:Cyclin [Geosmithia morbida]KAF4122534.1 Cyclin [Geosmithia morbida]
MPGGVCAVLDYEVEAMAEYVAEMATRVITPEAPITSAFRKFVSQILTSTRLPSTTILLGMNYLAKRINTMKSQGPYKASEGQVWRYLTVSLLLGSKFLDDNTFQNRSWSEVSGIPVAELNSLEFEWVQSMNWRLYVNLDKSKDYQAWLENWREWQQLKKRQAQAGRDKLSSVLPAINTDLARYSSSRRSPHSRYLQDQVAEYERYESLKLHQQQPHHHHHHHHQVFHHQDVSAWTHNPWNAAPLTPPDSGYGTPDGYGLSATSSNARYNDWFAQAAACYSSNANNLGRYSHAPAPNPFYQGRQSHYVHGYGYGHHHGWEHGLAECSCPNCVSPMKQAPYFATHSYGQTVMG